MAISDLNTRIENATTQLESDVQTISEQTVTVTNAVTKADKSAVDAQTYKSEALNSAVEASKSATNASASLDACKAVQSDIEGKGYLQDAPKDDNQYARKNGNWTVVTGGGGSGGGDVASVNGKTGVVVLTAADVKAIPEDTQLFSGSYSDLTDKPILFTGEYRSLTGTPALSTVATSGSYADLSNKPTIIGEAPTDGGQYARQSGKWAKVVASNTLSDPTITGTLFLNPAEDWGPESGAMLYGDETTFKVTIPNTYSDIKTPEATFSYDSSKRKWSVTYAEDLTSYSLLTEKDLSNFNPSLSFPVDFKSSFTTTDALNMRFNATNAAQPALQAVTQAGAIAGAVVYDNTNNKKWCVRNGGSTLTQAIATETFVENAIAAIPTGGGSGGATMGRTNLTAAQAWAQVQKLMPDGAFSVGNTFANAEAILKANGWSNGASFLMTTTTLAATAAFNIPENIVGNVKLTIYVNRDASGNLTSYDMEWKRVGGAGWFMNSEITSANFKGAQKWKTVS